MKLNVKRTFLVGLAFMSISAFWQLYDFAVPLILKNTYALGDTAAGVVMAMDNIVALFLLPLFGALSDKCRMKMGRRMPFMLFGGFAAAVLALAVPGAAKFASLPVFLALLACLLITMATFRSPTVALMPDVTPKPLRSKANAIINLMGAIGGAIVLLLTNFLLVKTVNAAGETVSDYTYLFMTVAALIMGAMLVIRAVIPERKLAAETDEINRRLDADKPAGGKTPLRAGRTLPCTLALSPSPSQVRRHTRDLLCAGHCRTPQGPDSSWTDRQTQSKHTGRDRTSDNSQHWEGRREATGQLGPWRLGPR